MEGAKDHRQIPDELHLHRSNPILPMTAAGSTIHKCCKSFRKGTNDKHPIRILRSITTKADLGHAGPYNVDISRVRVSSAHTLWPVTCPTSRGSKSGPYPLKPQTQGGLLKHVSACQRNGHHLDGRDPSTCRACCTRCASTGP